MLTWSECLTFHPLLTHNSYVSQQSVESHHWIADSSEIPGQCVALHILMTFYMKSSVHFTSTLHRGAQNLLAVLVRRICWQLCLQHNEAWLPSLNWGWPWTPTIDVRDFTTCRCGLAVLYKPLQLSKTLRALAQEVNIFSGCSVTHT